MTLWITIVAVALGCIGAILTRILGARAERAFPPIGEFVTVRGLRQHVVSRGEPTAPPIVFVHGAFGSCHDFDATILDAAARRYHCVAWDRPGHGYSERPSEGIVDPGVQARFLLDLIAELRLDAPLLVGFSYGGAVVLAAALLDPHAMRGVLMLNGPTHPWPDPIEVTYRLPTWPLLGPLAVETWLMPIGLIFADRAVHNAFAPEPVAASFARSPTALALRPSNYRANAADIRALKPFLAEQREHYEHLAVPVTMVVSEGDRVVSPTIHSVPMAAASPLVRVIRLPDAGHQILYSRPERVLEILDDLMR